MANAATRACNVGSSLVLLFLGLDSNLCSLVSPNLIPANSRKMAHFLRLYKWAYIFPLIVLALLFFNFPVVARLYCAGQC